MESDEKISPRCYVMGGPLVFISLPPLLSLAIYLSGASNGWCDDIAFLCASRLACIAYSIPSQSPFRQKHHLFMLAAIASGQNAQQTLCAIRVTVTIR